MKRELDHIGSELQEYCKKKKAKIGIGYKSFSKEGEAFVNPNVRFSTASVFKVFVLVDFYRRVMEGKVDPDLRITLKDTDRSPGSGVLQYIGEGPSLRLRDYARLMMIISDNTATDVLFDYLGRDSIAETISWLGLKHTSVGINVKDLLANVLASQDSKDLMEMLALEQAGTGAKNVRELLRSNIHRISGIHSLPEYERLMALEDNNAGPIPKSVLKNGQTTTPRDLVTTLEKVFKERILGNLTEEFAGIMAACETGPNRIRRGIPHRSILMHKTGTLEFSVVNDAGVVKDGQNMYAIVVLVNDISPRIREGYLEGGERIISDISKIVSREDKSSRQK